ncbi:MAG: glycine oxidase ThiO [Methylococcaceae bacterium]
MTSITDITIIGGGAVGLLTAREFVQAGLTVTVLEKGLLGQESSWAGGGILLPLYPWRQANAISQLVIRSHSLYPNLATQLLDNTGIDPQWTQCGLLISQNPDYEAARAWCDNYQVPYQVAGAEFFNGLNTQVQNPLWLPTIAQTRNPRLLKALIQDLRNRGVILIEQCELIGIESNKNQITQIKTSQGQFAVNQLVITTGAWTGELFSRLFVNKNSIQPEISPVKGQMLLFKAEPTTLKMMVLAGDNYLIPRRDGHILAGSTVEHHGFDKAITESAKQQLQQFAVNLLPALKNYPLVNHWAGLRPATTSGIPYIDRHPELENLFINAGHFRNGLVMGPASAQLLVDMVLNRTTAINREHYGLLNLH